MDTQLICPYDTINKIKKIKFSILSDDETKKMSVIKDENGIETSDLHDSTEPQRGGLNDARLGTVTNDILCGKCKMNMNNCVGHFGHIKLGVHLFNYNYFVYITKILDCICVNCAQLRINDKNILNKIMKNKPMKRMKIIKGLGKNLKNCWNCNSLYPKIKAQIDKKTNNILIEMEYKTEEKNVNPLYTGEDIWQIFKNISDENCIRIGINPELSRPESMLVENLPVPPIQVRPVSKSDTQGGIYGVDGLTMKLADIIRINNMISKDKIDVNGLNLIEKHILLAQANYTEYLKASGDSDNSKIMGKPLSQRLIGKQGRIRLTLLGKRVDFTGRTVITAGADLNVDEVGIPITIAKKLTYPVIINKYNLDEMKQFVMRTEYPIAVTLWKYSTLKYGKTILPKHLEYGRENVELNIGDIIERNLMDGDYILFNRQPTLHPQSMMTHKIKIINDPLLMTARLPVAVTTPYNADFDGDEMNIHIPQSIETTIELVELAGVSKQLISAASSKTIYGVVQDGLIGSYLISDKTEKLKMKEYMNLITMTNMKDKNKIDKIKKEKEYNGLDIINFILPNDYAKITYQLTKKHLGAQKDNSIIQILWDKYNSETTMDFLNNITKIANLFNKTYGFYIGINDVLLKKEDRENIYKTFETVILDNNYLITKYENNTDLITPEIYENQIYDKLRIVRENIGDIVVSNISKQNAFNVMLKCGSKGEAINIGQLSGGLGLQALDGKLQPNTYNGRTSPYVYRHDDRSVSRGLCTQSFLGGLTYPDFIAHATSARTGLIESVVKTSVTGYTQRKLIKSLEDISVKYDMTVRTAHDNIVQFIYGSSGASTTKQYRYNLEILEMKNEDIRNKYVFTENEMGKYRINKNKNQEFYNYLLKTRDMIRYNLSKVSLIQMILEKDFLLPVNMELIEQELKMNTNISEELNDEYIYENIEKILENENTKLICGNNKMKIEDTNINKILFGYIVKTVLAPKRIITEYKLNKEIFDKYINIIINKFNKNLIEPCAMIGCLAAQSIGEPLTQLTLKAFHKIGQPSVSNTLQGVPRMNELLTISKLPKESQMNVVLKEEYKTNKDIADKMASYMRHTTLGELRTKVDIYYDPKNTILDINKINTSFCDKSQNFNNVPWLYKIEINKDKLLERYITLLDIKSKLCNWWLNKNLIIKKEEKKILNKITQLVVLSSEENDDKLYIYIRINGKDIIKQNTKEIDEFNMNTITSFITGLLDNVKIKGIPKINNINFVSDESMIKYNSENGGIEKDKQYIIYTNGVNIEDIRYLNYIDLDKTISNNVYDMYLKYGIEIARSILMDEMITAIKTAGGYINYHHIALIVDMMTMTGDIVSIDRNGINKSDNGPLTRASYEKVIEQFINASVYNEEDKMKGVSSQIMTGQMIRGGTGGFDILINPYELLNYKLKDETKTDIINENQLITDIINNKKQNVSFFIPEQDENFDII